MRGQLAPDLKHLNNTGRWCITKRIYIIMYKNNIPYLNLMSIKYRVIILEDRRRARLDKGLA